MITKRELKNALTEELLNEFTNSNSKVYLDINKIEIDYFGIEDVDDPATIIVHINCGVEGDKSGNSNNYSFQIEYKDGSSLDYIRGCFYTMCILKESCRLKEDED